MVSVPVIHFDKERSARAFARHRALVKAEADDPSLAMEPWFIAQREAAYAAFLKAFARAA